MTDSRIVICIDNSEYPASLEMHKIYRMLPDKNAEQDGDLRVIDESREDYLYPAANFVMVEFPADVKIVLDKSFSHSPDQAA
jgi:hypothetical protein